MFSKESLKEIIIGNREFILNQVRDIVRRESINFPQGLKKVFVLYGVRRSGKTFVLYDLFRNHKDETLYIDFEDERLSDFRLEDFELLKETFLELNPHLLKKRRVFLFDEIQNISGWEKFCRRAVEKENIDVYVAGSSSKILPSEIHTSLRGRAWSIEVAPFSFKEFLKTNSIEIKNNLIYGQEKILIKKYFEDYLKWGGFPEVVLTKTDFEKNKILKEYLGSMFFKDLVERYKINNISLLEAMLDKLFSSVSQKFSLNSFYKQYKNKLVFSKDSLFSYYKYFLQSMLIFEVRKFSESSYVRMRNPAKIYLVDVGLAKKVFSYNLGWLLENIVFLELRKKVDKIFYFEQEGECDFVVNYDKKFYPFQVCYELNDENKTREINGLISCCKMLGIKKGMILTFDQQREFVKDKIEIKVAPVWKWLILDKEIQ